LFASEVQQMWVVGGVFDAPGGLCCGLVPPFDDTQTFNFWADPPAIQAVLTGLRPPLVSMVSHNATDMAPIRIPYIERLGMEGVTPEAQYVHALMSHPIIIFGLTHGQEAFWWDPLGVVAATLGDVVQFDFRRLRIVQTGPSMGATVATASHDN